MTNASSVGQQSSLGAAVITLIWVIFLVSAVVGVGVGIVWLIDAKVVSRSAALLPDQLRDRSTIFGMIAGDFGYMSPETMIVDENGRCFLKGSYPICASRGGRITVLISRQEDGYHVYVSDEILWKLNNLAWIRMAEGLVPVTRIHY